MPRETLTFDVLIIGGGPSGLSAAIRLAQCAKTQGKTLNIAVLEKGATIGAHLLSGAVLEPRALQELLPEWKTLGAPLYTEAKEDRFLWLTEKKAFRLPTPSPMQNKGNYLISIGLLCRFLAEQAEQLGVNILPGFSATEILYDEKNSVCGVSTSPKGINKEGSPGPRFQEGFALYASYTLFAEGCRGSLTQQLFEHYELRKDVNPQTYALGIKEIWEIPECLHQEGLSTHTIGWPLSQRTYGGSFMYHLNNRQLSLGLVIGLDYQNPYLNPYEEFQRFKMHPLIYPLLEKSTRLAYGARSLNEGGFQAIPRCHFPGGLVIGCAAGFLNVPKLKGIHTAMKSGMLAAETIVPDLLEQKVPEKNYTSRVRESWIGKELYTVRNIRPAFRLGLIPGLLYAALDTYLFRGKTPWTFPFKQADHCFLKKAKDETVLTYPPHDNHVSFDLSSSLYLSAIHAEENQPCHLTLKNTEIPVTVNWLTYQSPETRYCPSGVYEFLPTGTTVKLHMNASNCIHCKACDIKDPTQNIVWTPPEGGSGPNYVNM